MEDAGLEITNQIAGVKKSNRTGQKPSQHHRFSPGPVCSLA